MLSSSRHDKLLLVAIALNVCILTVVLTILPRANKFIPSVGDELPVPSMRETLTTVEDTEHFGIFGEQADSEWLATTPDNNGYVHFGEDHRIFATGLAHEMHCIRVLRLAIAVPAHPKANTAHAIHCLNYLRLNALCDADQTLEDFLPFAPNFTSSRPGETRVCRSWGETYGVFAQNTKEWLDLKAKMST